MTSSVRFALFLALCAMVLARSSATMFFVRGDLWCQGEPYVDARVMLMERDLDFRQKGLQFSATLPNALQFLEVLDPDDKMGEERSMPDGRFEVRGGESELGEEEPYLLIGHVCPQRGMPPAPGCHFVSRVELPRRMTHIETPPIHLDGLVEFEEICGDEDDY